MPKLIRELQDRHKAEATFYARETGGYSADTMYMAGTIWRGDCYMSVTNTRAKLVLGKTIITGEYHYNGEYGYNICGVIVTLHLHKYVDCSGYIVPFIVKIAFGNCEILFISDNKIKLTQGSNTEEYFGDHYNTIAMPICELLLQEWAAGRK